MKATNPSSLNPVVLFPLALIIFVQSPLAVDSFKPNVTGGLNNPARWNNEIATRLSIIR